MDLAVADEDWADQGTRPRWRKLWGVLEICVASSVFLAGVFAAGLFWRLFIR
jgi:hypothetical protein